MWPEQKTAKLGRVVALPAFAAVAPVGDGQTIAIRVPLGARNAAAVRVAQEVSQRGGVGADGIAFGYAPARQERRSALLPSQGGFSPHENRAQALGRSSSEDQCLPTCFAIVH